MSKATVDKWVDEQLGKITLRARDEFYMHLIEQEFGFWYRAALDGETIEEDEVEWLIKRRGFNDEEQACFRQVAAFFNDNGQQIRLLWAHLED